VEYAEVKTKAVCYALSAYPISCFFVFGIIFYTSLLMLFFANSGVQNMAKNKKAKKTAAFC